MPTILKRKIEELKGLLFGIVDDTDKDKPEEERSNRDESLDLFELQVELFSPLLSLSLPILN